MMEEAGDCCSTTTHQHHHKHAEADNHRRSSITMSTSRQRKKRFLGGHHCSHESLSVEYGCSKSCLIHTSGGERSRDKENRSDALNRLHALQKRNKLSSLYYSSDEEEDDEFPVASRRLSASLLQDSSGSEIDDIAMTDKSNDSDVFGADDEFCMLSIEPKPQGQMKKSDERPSGLLPGGGQEGLGDANQKSGTHQQLEGDECDGSAKKGKKLNGFKPDDSADHFGNWINFDCNDSELPSRNKEKISHVTEASKKTTPDHTDGNVLQKSPSHSLPGNFYKKKFPYMFTNMMNEGRKQAAGQLSLLPSSSSGSDSEQTFFTANATDSSHLASPVFAASDSVSPKSNGFLSKKRKCSPGSLCFQSKKRKSEESTCNTCTSSLELSPIPHHSSPPITITHSPTFPSSKIQSPVRQLSFERDESAATKRAPVVSSRTSDSDSDFFDNTCIHVPLSNKRRDANPGSQVPISGSIPKSKPDVVTNNIPSSASSGRMSGFKDADPVRLSVSPKSHRKSANILSGNQSLEEGMQFTDESLRKQLRDLFGNDSDEELEWQPVVKKTKLSIPPPKVVGRKSKKAKDNRYFIKKASGKKTYSLTASKPHDTNMKPESSGGFSESDDSDWEKRLLELVEDISCSSHRSKSGLALLKDNGKKSPSSAPSEKAFSTVPSGTSPKHTADTNTKPRNNSVSSFPGSNVSSPRRYDRNRGLIHVEPDELPKTVTLSSPPKLIKSVATPKSKRRCRRIFSNGSVTYVSDTDSSESSDDDVIPITHDMRVPAAAAVMPRRDVGASRIHVGTSRRNVSTVRRDASTSTTRRDVGAITRDVSTTMRDVGATRTDVGTISRDADTTRRDVGTIRRFSSSARRDLGQVISPRIREILAEDVRNDFDTMLDPILLRELEHELSPARPKKIPKSRREGRSDERDEMVVEVTLDDSIQHEPQSSVRLHPNVTMGTSKVSSSYTLSKSKSRSVTPQNRPHMNTSTSPSYQGHLTVSPRRPPGSPVFAPNPFNPTSPGALESPTRTQTNSKKHNITKSPVQSPVSATGNSRYSLPGNTNVIPFIPTSPALQSSPGRSRNRRSRQKTNRGSLNRPRDDDPVKVMQQIDDDEAMARRLQEQMDLEFAQALMREEESAAAAAQMASHQPSNSSYPHSSMAVMPTNFISPPPIQMPMPTTFNHPSASHFNQSNVPQTTTGRSPTVRGRRRQTRSQISPADQVAVNQVSNFEPPGDTAMYLHVAMGMGLLEQGRSPTISPPSRGHRRGRGRRRGAAALANAVQGAGNDYEALLALGDIIGEARPKGLTKSSIEQLPTKVYKAAPRSGKDEECSVCMAEYEEGEKLRILPCFHNFHVKCIDKWIKDNATCPICRVPVKLS